jgi:hypothetical protein
LTTGVATVFKCNPLQRWSLSPNPSYRSYVAQTICIRLFLNLTGLGDVTDFFPANYFASREAVSVALRYPAKMIQGNDWQAPWHR